VSNTADVVLGIETSCDETAAAVVAGGAEVRSSVVSSQVDVHAAFGGVVPELAGRAHLELLTPVVAQALRDAGLTGAGLDAGPTGAGLDAVAATVGPGLVGSLLVGVSEAKALSLAWGLPFVGVNHLEGHLFAALLDHGAIDWPVTVLLVSGGHTLLVSMEGPGRYRLLGQTLDDAAGEAFDKVARFLGLGYPGGPAIERAGKDGDPGAFTFPRAMLDDGLDLSFSGLKTAVVHAVRRAPDASDEDVAASFQQAVVDVLVTKARRAASASGAKGLCLAGGVAANGSLRAAFGAAAAELGIPAYLPSRAMCTDNAAMIAAAGWWQLEHVGPTPLDAGADPDLRLPLLDPPAGAGPGGPVARGGRGRYR
jgi:N6-L-threonylcarbamoyladenine synthase